MQAGQVFQERYRIEREVGRGSFGIVYAANELQSGRTVAIKVLLPWVRSDEGLRHRLKREARLTRMLASPHAVRVLDLDETPHGDLYIVMELLDGEGLSELLVREGRLKPHRAIVIGRQVLEALGEAHALGVIHRDVKPQNVVVCRSGNGADFVKVLDFGIAKVAGTADGSGLMETTRLTAPGNILGTPAYMSPEQCRGEALTVASDFYSLGVVLYEMVTGHVPFFDNNPMQVLVMHNNRPVPPLSSAAASLPLGRAILRALEKDPRKRFGSADEFAAALEGQPVAAYLAAIAARSPTGTMVLSALPATMGAASATGGNEERSGSAVGGVKNFLRRYWVALVIAAILAVFAATRWF
jgi:serine/threonine protein kinase